MKRGRFYSLFWRILIITAVLLGSSPVRGQATTPAGPVVIRLEYLDTSHLTQLASWLDIWEVNRQDLTLVAMVSPAQFDRLAAENYTFTIDAAKTAALSHQNEMSPGQTGGIPGYACYRTVEETYASMDQLVAEYPTLVQKMDIGDSWNKVNSGGSAGYDLWVLRLTNQNVAAPKPHFFLMGAIHAREYATAELAMRFAETLLNQYGVDADATWLLDHFELDVLAQTNPDGRKMAETGVSWRKNTNNTDGCSLSSYYGVDLNRNSSYHWGGAGASTNPCDETFRGSAAASEPETQALQNYVASILPDGRDETNLNDPAPVDYAGLFISLHSYGGEVMWPWGDTSALAPNSTALRTLGRKMAYFNGYLAEQSIGLYPTTGASDDWAYGTLGVPAYTFEVGGNFFESCSSFEASVYPDNLNALMYAFKTVYRPYQSPAGPDSLLVTAPTAVGSGVPFTLTAQANDTRYVDGEPTQAISAARYSLDLASWDTGAVLEPMQAADGVFDSSVEEVSALIDPAGWALGRHTLFVESQDADGNWGVPSAVFVDIVAPDVLFNLESPIAGQSQPAGFSAIYSVTIANQGNVTDSYQLSVSNTPAWATVLSDSDLTVDPGNTVSFQVQVTIPASQPVGASDQAEIQAASQLDPTKIHNLTLTTTVKQLHMATLSVAAAAQSGDPGQSVIYPIAVHNIGNGQDTYGISVAGNNWMVIAPATVGPLAAGDEATVDVVVQIPADAASKALDRVIVTVVSQNDADHPASLDLKTTARSSYWPEITPQPASLSGYTGRTVSYLLNLKNKGNARATYTLTLDGGGWQASTPVSSITLSAGGSRTIQVDVRIPVGSAQGDSHQILLEVTPSASPEQASSAVLETIVAGSLIYLPYLGR